MLVFMIGDCDGRSRGRPVASCLETWLHLMGQDGGFVPDESSPCTHNVSCRQGLFCGALLQHASCENCRLHRMGQDGGTCQDSPPLAHTTSLVLAIGAPQAEEVLHIVTPMIQSESKGRVGQEHRWRVL